MLQYAGVPKHVQSTFWDRLEEASRDVGLPSGLSDVGRELDVWPSAVQKWRDGINYPGKNNLITLARTRGVTTEWLLTGRGPKLSEAAMDQATRDLLKLWTALPKEAQERLLTAARYEKTTSDSLPKQADAFPKHSPDIPRRRESDRT